MQNEKTNPAKRPGVRHPLITWTFDAVFEEDNSPVTPPEDQGPSHFEFASAVLQAIRPYTDAYQALLRVVEFFWPIPPPETA